MDIQLFWRHEGAGISLFGTCFNCNVIKRIVWFYKFDLKMFTVLDDQTYLIRGVLFRLFLRPTFLIEFVNLTVRRK